ncbi:MAG: hypothetical protein FWF08_00280 [Oscillospiraceae bacterium]|nr:hypothetical protein [Oscillospiraceae bacterium]
MGEMILNVNTLPDHLFRYIRSDKIKFNEENGVITLTPVADVTERAMAAIDRLQGMFSGKLSTEDFIAQKQTEKDLEL